MAVRLEHANLTVGDIEGMIRFLQTALPEFLVRGEGISQDGSRWVHIGTEETYVALSPTKAEAEKRWMPCRGIPGVNHFAYEVDDVEALRERIHAAKRASLSQASVLLRPRGQRLGVHSVPLSGSR